MRTWFWIGLLLAGATGAFPYLLEAQIFPDPCCQSCQLPVVQCTCQRTRPVVQTHLREEKVTTYRDVIETRYRDECIVEQTPVTTYEDRIETVWVPQHVTRKVARTVMVPQVKTRTVPYQVLQRVPETTTRVVPYQTVHHVTETVPMAFAPAPIVSQTVITPAPLASIPTMPAITVPAPQTAEAPRRAPPLAPADNRSSWQTIPSRSGTSRPASSDRFGGYESNYDQPVPTPIDNEPGVRKSSWRGHVPGAASAWNYSERVYR